MTTPLPSTFHCAAAEEAVIGCCILEATAADGDLDPAEFFDPRLRALFAAIRLLRVAGKPPDPVLVAAACPPGVGAIGLISGCVTATPTADNVHHYAAMVRDASLKRRLVALHDVLASASSGAETLEAAWRALSAISARPQADVAMVGPVAFAAAQRAAVRADEIRDGIASSTLVPTGLRDVDIALGGGLPLGVVTVEGGRPSSGKSSLARGIARAASAAGYGVHVFSLEDRADTYGDRVIADLGEVELGKLRAGAIDGAEARRLLDAASTAHGLRWGIDDRAGLSSAQISIAVRRHRRDLGTKLVIVDYVQLMNEREAGPRKIDQVGAALKGLVRMAREENVAVLLLSQLNRECEKENRRPRMSDLRECGELEQDARIVFFTHHLRGEDGTKTGKAEIVIAKNNNGQGETRIDVRWDGAHARYQDVFSNTWTGAPSNGHPNAPGMP